MSFAIPAAKWRGFPAIAVREFFDPPRAVLLLILAGTIIRLIAAAAFGLGSDESYTVANARHFALSYVDYPPLHAWIVGAWAQIWGSESPFVVRLPFIAFFAGSTWQMFRLTEFFYGARAGLWAALIFNLAPVFTLPHASWVLPDGPLIVFMLSGAHVVARLLFAEVQASSSVKNWILAGALAGLAMLCKYHGAFLLAGTFVFLLSVSSARRILATPAPWLGALTALLLFLPVPIWNTHHDWTGLFFQSNRLTNASHFDALRIFGGIGGQIAYLTPWIFIPLAIVWMRSLWRGPAAPREWFLAMLASGPIIFFTLANAVSPGLPHWPMPGWLFMFPVLGAEAARVAQKHPARMIGAAAASGVAVIAVIIAFSTNARTGWLTPQRYTHSDPTIDLLNWNELDAVLAKRHLLNAQTPAIAAIQWKEAGKLNYILGRKFPVLCLCSNPQQFRYLQTPEVFAGKNIIIVGAHRDVTEMRETVAGMFNRIEPLQAIALHRSGKTAIELTVMRGIGFRPAALANKQE